MRSPIFKWYLSAVSLPRMQAVWSASNAAYWASGILASPKRGRSSLGSSANWAKLICSSPLYLPPNQLKGETATTPGNLSMIARCRAGSNAAIEILLRTTTRNAAPMSSGGTVTSRNATNSVTSRNKLTATLRIDNVARRLLRSPFFRMKEPTVMESKQGRAVIAVIPDCLQIETTAPHGPSPGERVARTALVGFSGRHSLRVPAADEDVRAPDRGRPRPQPFRVRLSVFGQICGIHRQRVPLSTESTLSQ